MHAYDRELCRENADAPSLLSLVRSEGFSEKFTHLASVLLMIPDESRLPLLTTTSLHVNQTVTSRIPVADLSEISRIMYSTTLTKSAGQDLFQSTVLQRIMEGTFNYDFELSNPSRALEPFRFQPGSNTTLKSSEITFESIPTPLRLDHCYVFNKSEGIQSYDAVI